MTMSAADPSCKPSKNCVLCSLRRQCLHLFMTPVHAALPYELLNISMGLPADAAALQQLLLAARQCLKASQVGWCGAKA